MSVTKQDIEYVQHIWTTNIKHYGLVKYFSNFGKSVYMIHDLRTGFWLHMEYEDLYDYTINEMLKAGAFIFNNVEELPVQMTIEEHEKYINNIIFNKDKNGSHS